MPSVEMRRSTRVFVPKAKDDEFVRVLRSGRRLWVESGEFKHRATENGGQWCAALIENRINLKPPPPSRPLHRQNECPMADDPMDIDDRKSAMEVPDTPPSPPKCESRMFVNVYNRKRNRKNSGVSSAESESWNSKNGDRKFGLHFVRRQRRKVKAFGRERGRIVEQEQEDEYDHGLLSIVVNSSSNRCGIFSRLLISVLKHMTRQVIQLAKLSVLLLSTSISPVFASRGIHFMLDQPSIQQTGLCRIFGTRQLIPLFTVDFSAVPFCFLHLHATMFLRSVRLSLSCLCSIDFVRENENTDIDESLSYIDYQSDHSLGYISYDKDDESKGMKVVGPISGGGRLVSRTVQYRSGVTTRSRSKRRRRSLRTRKARKPLPFVLQKASGSAVSDRLAVKKNSSLSAVPPNRELKSSAQKSSSSEISVPRSSSLAVNVDVELQCCTANLLVVETDKGYRIEGAEILLDVSASNEWLLVVKKDGSTRYSLKVQREMRPSPTTNRFTHAVIWAAEAGWKLEFPEKKEWSIFKELYKLCWEKNAVPASPVVKIIPVPGVREVIDSWDSTCAPFKRPDSYIRMASDELSRALSSRTANYDMDSEDEEWLSELNKGLDIADVVSEESFELMIDAFEKAAYYRPEECDDQESAASLCCDLASSVVAGEVCRYWLKKRNQRRAPLNRVFQLNQPRRAQLITKPVLRKKRSLKRSSTQPIQRGRGKDSSVLQAIAAEHNVVEEQCSNAAAEDAKASASRSVERAIAKRQRAQFLMENADLAVYRATMALRIADAAQVAELEQVSAHFLE
uniref:Enhancer of polycomb-like protein n=1 Tax=Opuntia streptacantha TaxID=393608 RepID=A0A7C9AJJ5_OPUST